MKNIPPRVHVLLARDTPLAAVIRRGPAKVACVVAWNRANDTFTVGDWVRSRVYEDQSDISPDGKYLIYTANNGLYQEGSAAQWTAISIVPHLKPLLHWQEKGVASAGGLFTGPRSYWLNDARHPLAVKPETFVRDHSLDTSRLINGKRIPVYAIRLGLNGWKKVATPKEIKTPSTSFEKQLPGGWTLIKHVNDDPNPQENVFGETHTLSNEALAIQRHRPFWEWADWDRHRLVWIERGKLWAATLGPENLTDAKLLKDFDEYKFDPNLVVIGPLSPKQESRRPRR